MALDTARPDHSPAEAAIVARLTAFVDALRAGGRDVAPQELVTACRFLARRTGDVALSELIGAHGELSWDLAYTRAPKRATKRTARVSA
jgi:hypothetical protein